jgi:hypothetical protein
LAALAVLFDDLPAMLPQRALSKPIKTVTAAARRVGALLKTGVIDVHGHVVTGQSVGVNDPLGTAPRSS